MRCPVRMARIREGSIRSSVRDSSTLRTAKRFPRVDGASSGISWPHPLHGIGATCQSSDGKATVRPKLSGGGPVEAVDSSTSCRPSRAVRTAGWKRGRYEGPVSLYRTRQARHQCVAASVPTAPCIPRRRVAPAQPGVARSR